MGVSSDHGRVSGLSEFSATRDTRNEFDRGYADGERELPRSDSRYPSPYEVDILMNGRQEAQKYLRTMEIDIGRETEELALRKQQVRSTYRTEREELGNSLSNRLDDLENEVGETSVKMGELIQKRESAQERVSEIAKEVGRPMRVHLVYKIFGFLPIYILILLLLAVADVTANQPVFLRFFTDAPLFSWMLAAGFGLLLVFLAHASGMFLKRSRMEGRGRDWRDRIQTWLGIPAILIVSFFLMYFVGALRQILLNEEEVDRIRQESETVPQAETGGNVFGNVAQGGFGQDPTDRVTELLTMDLLPWNLSSESWALIGINFAVFLAGMVTAYIRYDSHPDYEAAEKKVDEWQDRIDALRAEYRARRADILEDNERALTNVRSRADRNQNEIDKRESKLLTLQRQRDSRIREFETNILQRIMRYQDGNMASRQSEPPGYFGEPTQRWVRKQINDLLNPPLGRNQEPEEEELGREDAEPHTYRSGYAAE